MASVNLTAEARQCIKMLHRAGVCSIKDLPKDGLDVLRKHSLVVVYMGDATLSVKGEALGSRYEPRPLQRKRTPVTINGVDYPSMFAATKQLGLYPGGARVRVKSSRPKFSGWVENKVNKE